MGRKKKFDIVQEARNASPELFRRMIAVATSNPNSIAGQKHAHEILKYAEFHKDLKANQQIPVSWIDVKMTPDGIVVPVDPLDPVQKKTELSSLEPPNNGKSSIPMPATWESFVAGVGLKP